MKQLLYIPVNSYLLRGKSNPASLKRCVSQCKRHFSGITNVQGFRPGVLNNSVLGSEKQDKILIGLNNRFSSEMPRGNDLMDFDVWLRPTLFRSLANLYYFFFALKKLDESFSLVEFNRSTAVALEVVTTLLSQLRFAELEGLLTQDCKQKVEKNLKSWPKEQAAVLAVKPEMILRTAPCDVIMFTENEDRTFVEIRVIHYVWLKYSSKFETEDKLDSPDMLFGSKFHNQNKHENLDNLYMCGVFNSKFIREFTKDCADQWIINAINVKCWCNILASMNHHEEMKASLKYADRSEESAE